MKILWLTHRDMRNPRAGGAERTIYEVSKRLAEKGHNITLLTGGWKGCTARDHIDGIAIFRYGTNIGPHLALPIFLLKNKFDIVVNDLGHAVPWVISIIIGKNSIVFFRHLHARSLPGQVSPLLAKFITSIEKCYFLIYGNTPFVTESSTSNADLRNLRIQESMIHLIPPGVNSDLFKPKEKTAFPTMVYFGGMRKYKRPEESVYLLKNLIDKMDVHLVIVGTGPQLSMVEDLVRELKLRDSVTFTGRLGERELASIVASSWLNIHASVTEGWGYSILEASSAGTTTVAYDVPGVADAIENGINGLKVKDGDRRSLADAALEILQNPQRWWSSSIEVAKKYSWDKTAEMWDILIHKISDKQ
jgi:glycosyltransferase involved in cell wall biosynthesis